MNKFLELFERIIVIVLILIMVLIVVLATLVLGWAIFTYLFLSENYLLDAPELLDVLGYAASSSWRPLRLIYPIT
jgi:hypothetical protein